jgi:hypothetical protein
MRKITLLLIALCLGGASALAQGYTDSDKTLADSEFNLRNNFWFSTNNAASLSIRPADVLGDLSLSYQHEGGGLHVQQDPQSLNDVTVHTSGFGKVGEFSLWGDFSFQNRFEQGVRHNSIRYEIEEDMPYYFVDTFSSGWNKQAYLMSMKVASPVCWDRVSFGLEAIYNSKVGGKQKDPRCETYKYDVSVYPSAAILLGKSTVGVYGFYTHGFERSTPSTENYRKSQRVFITRGLGEGKIGKVGDNDGLKTYYYKKDEFGGGLQYNFTAPGADIFAEAVFSHTEDGAFQQPKLPEPMGRIERNTVSADLQGLFGKARAHKVSLGGVMKLTSGIEPLLNLNTTSFEQNWDVVAENPMSSFTRIMGYAGYEYAAGRRNGHFDWSAGLDALFSMRDYSYLSPADQFNEMGALFAANGAKQLVFGRSALLLKAEGGYHLSLGGQYIYAGGDKTADVADLYRKDIAILTSNYLMAGGRVNYSIKAKKVQYNFDLSARYLNALGAGLDRLSAQFTAGILF